MTRAGIFLETSVQTYRIVAERNAQEQVEKQFRTLAPNLFTSHYVWMEYQRTVVADYAHIHQLMVTHRNWGKVIAHLLAGQRSFRPQAALRCSQIVGLLHEESAGDWKFALRLIEQALHLDLRERFWMHVTALSDPIGCDLVALGCQRQVDTTFAVASTCRKATATCHLPEFLFKQRGKLQAIADYLVVHSHAIKNQARVERLLTEVLQDPRAVLGQSACWPLGDVIIALQVPSNTALWTRDPDFGPLTAALGIPLYEQPKPMLGS
ncbi:MAG: hypothetical protein U0350_06450 [Caldilineaceae bacterium]